MSQWLNTSPHHLPLHQRAGDSERSATCDRLAAHYAAGRLQPDELDARLKAALEAVSLSELRALLADLPGQSPGRAVPVPDQRWRHRDVLAAVTAVGALFTCFALILIMVISDRPEMGVAAFVTAGLGGVGGLALGQVIHRLRA